MALEEELMAMRANFGQDAQQSGLVLPSEHEVCPSRAHDGTCALPQYFLKVCWHGRKEHMEALSPVAAFTNHAIAQSRIDTVAAAGRTSVSIFDGEITRLVAYMADAEVRNLSVMPCPLSSLPLDVQFPAVVSTHELGR